MYPVHFMVSSYPMTFVVILFSANSTSNHILVIDLKYLKHGPFFTLVKTKEGGTCVFPFNYQSESIEECIRGNGIYWCSLTNDYDRDQQRGTCIIHHFVGRCCTSL